MARVLTNNTFMSAARESSPGVAPTTGWFKVNRDTISDYGAQIETVVGRPISDVRGRTKGTVVNVTAAVGYAGDLTLDGFSRFAEGFFFCEYVNVEFDLKLSGAPPTATSGTDVFNISAASTSLGAKLVYNVSGAISLLWGKGYTNAANNGTHVLAADVAATDTTVQVASTLVTETPPTNASLLVHGVRVTSGDCTFTLSGSTATLVSAADIADWSTLGFKAGMTIHIGGIDTDGSVVNAFDDAGTDDVYGYARISSISGATLNLDKLDENLGATDTNTGVLDVLYGRMARDVLVTADATDNRYQELSWQFELGYPNLYPAAATGYEYVIGAQPDEITVNLPLQAKATFELAFTALNADDFTSTRKTGPSSAVDVLRSVLLNTSSDLVSITTDAVSAASGVCFKSLSLTIANALSPEYCLGVVGASFVNVGLFTFDIEGQLLFTDPDLPNAIKNNTTVTFGAILRNEDGAIAFDVPELTLGGGGKEYPVDQSVLINVTGASFTSSTFGHNAAVTIFAAVPTAA